MPGPPVTTGPRDVVAVLVARLTAAGLHPAVLAHSLRVHALARAVAADPQVVPSPGADHVDEVALAVACLFHDAGTIPTARPDRFEVIGADLALDCALDVGLDPEAARRVWEAVALHTSPGIAERHAPLTRLVRLGVRADFGDPGLRSRHAAAVTEAETEWPRADIELVLQDLVVEGARVHPDRAAAPSWTADLVRGAAGLARARSTRRSERAADGGTAPKGAAPAVRQAVVPKSRCIRETPSTRSSSPSA